MVDPGVTACEGTSCEDEPPPESVCLEHIAADIIDDGCGVFVAGSFGGVDDRNPGTKAKPVYNIRRAIELARTGRGRVFICNDGFIMNPITVPSGVDLLGGFDCRKWGRDPQRPWSELQPAGTTIAPPVTIEPAGPEDSGAADGGSTLADLDVPSWGPLGILVQSNTAVEIVRSNIAPSGSLPGSDGEPWLTIPSVLLHWILRSPPSGGSAPKSPDALELKTGTGPWTGAPAPSPFSHSSRGEQSPTVQLHAASDQMAIAMISSRLLFAFI
ncbi:hypothetical protein [Sorangium sp. So ce1153]|uniref:hypothetical protein n=1 Tax=Sorangium sp. So ce1153 TaxID=3133333 RepID=UPI003F640E5E